MRGSRGDFNINGSSRGIIREANPLGPEMLSDGAVKRAAVTLARFERDAQATAALTSPHTIRLFDFGQTNDGTFYYVMELLDGCDLESFVREHGPLSPHAQTFSTPAHERV